MSQKSLIATITIVCMLLICSFRSIADESSAVQTVEIQQEDLKLVGQSIQGGLIIGHTRPGAIVTLDDRELRVSEQGVFLVGFNRDDSGSVALRVKLPDGSTIEHEFSVESREYDIQRIEGVPQRTVTPPEDQLKRIRQETALIVAARGRDDSRTDFLNGFIWPVTGTITGVYGSQRVYNGEPRRPHYGIDIAAPAGTSVVAPAAGIISLVHDDMFYSGGTIILDHGHGLSSAFLHLSKVTVSKDQYVEQGDEIGKVGSTGRSTGAHLDWRINLFKQRLDAALVAPPMPTQ